MKTFVKTPSEVLDYVEDFAPSTNGRGNADWLQTGETISSATVTVESGITKDSDSITDTSTSVTVWLSGGTAGNTYRVDVEITTDAVPARTSERSFLIRVVDRR